MTSRERILAALSHKETDGIPLDFGGHRSSGIMAIAYSWLKKKLGITSGDIYVYDMIQQLAIVEPQVLDIFGVDTIEMGRAFLLDKNEWNDWVLPDGTPCKIPYYINVEKRGDDWYLLTDDGYELGIQKKGCLYFEQTYFPLIDRGIENDDFSDLEDMLARSMWGGISHPGAHLPLTDKGLKEMARKAKKLRESTDRAIIGLFGGNLFEVPQFLYRMDNYLMYLRLYPDAVHCLSEKLCNIYLNNLEKWLGAVGPYIDIILFGDDLGGQAGPLISPEMYREYYKPYHKKMWKRTKELADVKINLHSCGGIEPFLSDMIDAGLDAVNPVQISSDGMNPRSLKAKYGEQITFWGGGCDTQEVLPKMTPAKVTNHVRKQIEIFRQNGGFVFQQVHNIQANVPTENIIAMFKAVNEGMFGDIPGGFNIA